MVPTPVNHFTTESLPAPHPFATARSNSAADTDSVRAHLARPTEGKGDGASHTTWTDRAGHGLALLLGSASVAQATIVERFHYSFTDSFSDNVCGIDVEVEVEAAECS